VAAAAAAVAVAWAVSAVAVVVVRRRRWRGGGGNVGEAGASGSGVGGCHCAMRATNLIYMCIDMYTCGHTLHHHVCLSSLALLPRNNALLKNKNMQSQAIT